LVWTVVFLIGTYVNLTSEVSDAAWMNFWRTFILINIAVSAFVILWFAIGGTRDLKDMLRRLHTMVRDHRDDGFVTGGVNLDEAGVTNGAETKIEPESGRKDKT
jgi:hypothetical protein